VQLEDLKLKGLEGGISGWVVRELGREERGEA